MPPATRRPAARSGRGAATEGVTWEEVALAPVVLVRGAEGLLADRAIDRLIGLAKAADPGVEVTRFDADQYTPGALGVLTSPSLFAEDKVLVVDGLERGTEELLAEATTYLGSPAPGVVMVLRYATGQRGKKLLDALKAAKVPVVACDAITSDSDKTAFVGAELRRAGRRADGQAVRALVDAVGSDLRELAAACSQLVADTTGLIGADVIERYYGGRIEATGFRVADAAVAGQAGEAVALLRHALATGVDPVPMVAALAMKLRTLAKVGAVRSKGQGALRDLGLAPWQVDRAMKELRRWTPEGLATAISAVAQADAEVKGESRDPRFAVERAVLRVAQASGS
ncbi:DNA polymerase III subunit delta [Cellulomonas rhizosphaerae]|uniref:DNA polymerase III subunit delta n=1 Tax=Cellulomonas rhizosphaerae TaxID=2293719 RepID=UPI0018F49245|nr:DNA polymerase III subunit delta [Cellulomonas rhizosphaerae]